MGQFINTINDVRKNYSKYDDWDQAQADERAKKEYIAKNFGVPQDKLELTKKRTEAVIRATEILDGHSEDNCENMEQATQMVAGFSMMPLMFLPLLAPKVDNYLWKKSCKLTKELADTTLSEQVRNAKQLKLDKLNKQLAFLNSPKFQAGLSIAQLGLAFATSIGFILWGNSKQKEASRIGRFQAKQNELKNVKNFVSYTPEQLEEAKKIAEKMPDKKDRNGLIKMYKEKKAMMKDKKAYKEWLKNKDPKEIEKLKAMKFTQAELDAAKDDQELITTVVKEINNKAEDYSENLENVFDTINVFDAIIAIPIGFGINKLWGASVKGLNKLREKLIARREKLPEGKSLPKLLEKIANHAEFKQSKVLKAVVSIALPTITALGIAGWGTMLQKDAARVGRYVARKDLTEHPEVLMAYSDEDMAKAKDVKAPDQKRGLWKKLSESFDFLKTFIKDKKEYDKYKKTDKKEKDKIRKAYEKIEITEQQKKDALKLQKNIFRAFDEVDEMSQRYSEDTEAGCEIAKQIGDTGWSLSSIGALALGGIMFAKGKFPIAKIVNSITNMSLKKDSTLRAAINDFYSVLKTDKNLMKEFHLSIRDGNVANFVIQNSNPEIQVKGLKFLQELMSISPNPNIAESKTYRDVIQSLLDKHLKNGFFAKWARNMTVESLLLRARMKAPEEVIKNAKLNDWHQYKTLIGTGIVGGIPILGTIIGVPYAFNAWLTNIQKKAGRIGVMKAMEQIDDPRVFAQKSETSDAKANPSEQKEEAKSTNLLKNKLAMG